MKIPKITELVNKTSRVWFEYYRDGNLWYSVELERYNVENQEHPAFVFPVPISDTGTATFKATDKSIFFMRWIRKHIEELEQEAKGDYSSIGNIAPHTGHGCK